MLFGIILLAAITLFSAEATDNQVKVIRPPTCNIKRPCPDFDLKCIQKEFIKRNWFGDNVGNQPEGEPLIVDTVINTPLPFFGVTIKIDKAVITGLDNGKVTEFYINEDTNKAVFSCKYCDVVVNASGVMEVHRAGQENVEFFTTACHEEYSTIKTTTIITGLYGPPEMSTHFDECKMTNLNYGRGADKIKDKDVKRVFQQFDKELAIAIKEVFLQKEDIFQDYFVNNVIGKGIPPPEEESPPAVPPAAYAFATATAGAY